MLSWLVSTALRLRVVVFAASVLLLIVGFRSLRHAPMDVFPEFAPPYVEIQTEAPGLSTQEVESLVSMPLENALNGTAGVKTIRSKSVLGLSSIVLIFTPGTDLIKARQLVQERLTVEATRLPNVARPPVMLQPLSSMSRLLKIGVWSKDQKLSQRDLTVLALWTIRPRLMAIPGVANVAIWGQRDRQFQVLVDPERLRANGVTLDAVVRAAGDATVLDTGGFVDTPNQRLAIRHLSPIVTPEDLARTVVDFRGGAPVRLGDVAEVVIGSPPAIGDSVINDGPGLLLIVEKQPQSNTLEVTRQVEAALKALEPGLKDVEIDPKIFRPATFIERALDNLSHSLLMGCGLVAIILIAFLFDWRTAIISLTAIPLSLVAAVLVLTWWGASINTMVLAGLVIALGEVVDDAIIDVENIVRRLRLNRELVTPLPAFQVVLDASLEVRSSVVYASLIVTLVFLPIFFLGGLAGSFFRPLAMSYILAILASLMTALTVTPALSLMLLSRRTGEGGRVGPAALRRAGPPESAVALDGGPALEASLSHPTTLATGDIPVSPLSRALVAMYRVVLPPLVDRPLLSMAVLFTAFAMAGAAYTRTGQEFLPNFRETDFLMHFYNRPSTSIEAMHRITLRASRELRSIEGVQNFGSHIGRAEVADEVYGPYFTELWISIDPNVDYDETLKKIQTAVDGYPGLYRDVQTYLKERIKEVLTGAGASVVVRIYGPELAVLRAKGKEVEKAIADVPGIVNLKVEPQVLVPQIEVRLRPEVAERFGLTAGYVRRATTTLIKGAKVGEVFEGQKKFDVVVWSTPETRHDLTALQQLVIDTPAGVQLRLGDVADVQIVPTPNEIKREGASRRLDITCNVQGRDLGSVAREIESRVKKLSFDNEYHPEFLGEYAARQESSDRLLSLSLLAFIGIVLILYVDFQSWRLTALVTVTLPFALIGGVAGVLLTGGVLSLGSLVGFVTVLGIAARNGIMLVSHYRHLEEVEGVPFSRELVLRGAEERLSPILMTALATGLALVPIIFGGIKPGQEIEHPLAVVILGGLVTSTLLNVFLLPPLYARFGRR